MKYGTEMASGGMTHKHKVFHDDQFRHSNNIEDITSTI
jgi:hypothetical protein